MAPKGGKGFRQEWDEIDKINQDLVDLMEALDTSAQRYMSDCDTKAEHFGASRIDAGRNAGSAAEAALEQLKTALDDAVAYLKAWTSKTNSAVETHQKSDSESADEYIKTAKGVE
jgi:hypothetical protein